MRYFIVIQMIMENIPHITLNKISNLSGNILKLIHKVNLSESVITSRNKNLL